MDNHSFNESELEIHSPGDSRVTTLERLSPSKAQGQGDSSLRTPQSDNCQSTKLELLCRQLENTNRTLSNFEARLDHLSQKLDNQMDQFNRRLDSYMEYCDRKVSNNEGDIRELDNLVNQMPTFKHMETLLAENRIIRSNHQSPTNDNPQPGGINQYMHMHATPASPVCCVQSSTPMNLPTTHSCNSFRPVSVPAVAVQTIRPCLEQNNAVTTGSDKIDLPVLSTCTNTSTYTMKPKPSNMNIGFTKPNNYDGKSSWTDYQVHFETVSKLNQWTDEIKALKLISCMQDSALSTIGEIDTNNIPHFEELIHILIKRFAPENQTELYRSQIDARIRKKGETLPELAQDIKRLVRLAYPNAPVEVRDSLAYRSFRDALNDQDLEWAICQGNRDTIDEALHLGLKYEAFHNGRKKPFLRYQKVDSDTETTKLPQVPPSKTRTCSYCHKKGHLIRDCYKRKRDQSNTLDQIRHGEETNVRKGHNNSSYNSNQGNY